MPKRGFSNIRDYGPSSDIVELRIKNSNKILYEFKCQINDKKTWANIINELAKKGWDLKIVEVKEEGWIN